MDNGKTSQKAIADNLLTKAYARAADNLYMSPIGSTSLSVSLQSAQNSGLATISAGSQQLNQDAQQIANPGNPNVTNALLDLSQSRLLVQAGADVIGASNQMLGTLLDVAA